MSRLGRFVLTLTIAPNNDGSRQSRVSVDATVEPDGRVSVRTGGVDVSDDRVQARGYRTTNVGRTVVVETVQIDVDIDQNGRRRRRQSDEDDRRPRRRRRDLDEDDRRSRRRRRELEHRRRGNSPSPQRRSFTHARPPQFIEDIMRESSRGSTEAATLSPKRAKAACEPPHRRTARSRR